MASGPRADVFTHAASPPRPPLKSLPPALPLRSLSTCWRLTSCAPLTAERRWDHEGDEGALPLFRALAGTSPYRLPHVRHPLVFLVRAERQYAEVWSSCWVLTWSFAGRGPVVVRVTLAAVCRHARPEWQGVTLQDSRPSMPMTGEGCRGPPEFLQIPVPAEVSTPSERGSCCVPLGPKEGALARCCSAATVEPPPTAEERR